jgi:hypothetical protein
MHQKVDIAPQVYRLLTELRKSGGSNEEDLSNRVLIYLVINNSKRRQLEDASLLFDALPPLSPAFPVTQMWFNRALASLGIACFRRCEFIHTCRCLSAVISEGRQKMTHRQRIPQNS